MKSILKRKRGAIRVPFNSDPVHMATNTNDSWQILEANAYTGFHGRSPLPALARAEIPAIVFRQAMPVAACEQLVQRLIHEQLLFDPHQPMPASFRSQVIPEGFYREGTKDSYAWASDAEGRTLDTGGQPVRIDIGTSLGYRGSDPAAFFEHAEQSHQLFARVFAEIDPVRVLYEHLRRVAGDKHVVTAHEPDGRRYGPAIVRAHYGGYTYEPHFDSVRDREKRTDYAVHDFETQIAGVLVLQNARQGARIAQCKIHHTLWTPELDPHLTAGTFHEYAEQNNIDNVEVCLEPGDLYFFNTGAIHEVPGVAGELPRIVVAVFIGYSEDRDDIFVWS